MSGNARAQILAAANRGRRARNLPTLYMRHLQLAVFKCRQLSLVGPDVLAAAGYRAAR